MLKALGITCGIGSMLIGARNAGFDILGNIEWRSYYDTGTFEKNFEGSFYVRKWEDLPLEERRFLIREKIDLVMSHPECGNFSNFSSISGGKEKLLERNKKAGDIPLFVSLLNKVKPNFFVMDNLPKSLVGYPISRWVEELPDYDLFPEWISNYHYGNIQKFRNRFFMIGAKKDVKFYFTPGEEDNFLTVREVLQDVDNLPNQTLQDGKKKSFLGNILSKDGNATVAEVAKFFRNFSAGVNPPYINREGIEKRRRGSQKIYWNKHAHVLLGSEGSFHPKTGWPLTCRERARIQGIPDSFVFILDDECGNKMLKQTGKCMPIQFCEYVSNQIACFIKGKKFTSSGKRLIKSNKEVDEAKRWYCKNVGYSNQSNVCKVCWLNCEGKEIMK